MSQVNSQYLISKTLKRGKLPMAYVKVPSDLSKIDSSINRSDSASINTIQVRYQDLKSIGTILGEYFSSRIESLIKYLKAIIEITSKWDVPLDLSNIHSLFNLFEISTKWDVPIDSSNIHSLFDLSKRKGTFDFPKIESLINILEAITSDLRQVYLLPEEDEPEEVLPYDVWPLYHLLIDPFVVIFEKFSIKLKYPTSCDIEPILQQFENENSLLGTVIEDVTSDLLNMKLTAQDEAADTRQLQEQQTDRWCLRAAKKRQAKCTTS